MRSTSRVRTGFGLAAMAVSAALLLSACSGGGQPSAPGSAPSAEDLAVVKVDIPVPVMSLDPIATTLLQTNQVIGLTSASLFQFAKHSVTETEPVLAESIEASEDGLTHTVTLKDGLTFSDGSPLTATNVVNSILRLRDTPGQNQSSAAAIKDAQASDERTVVITLNSPNADLTPTLALPQFAIVAAEPGDDAYFDGEPVFSGAYVPEGDALSNSFALVRNESFGGGEPAVERLEFSVTDDAVTSATRLQTGDIDLASNIQAESIPQLTGDVQAISIPDWVATLYILPNNREGKLTSDVRIRQAIAWAIDRKALAAAAYGDDAQVQATPFPVASDFPQPIDVYQEQDLDRAKELLAGTACENGCSIAVTYFATDEAVSGRAALVLQQQLEPLGITVTAEPVESSQFIDNSLSGAFEMNLAESGGFNVMESIAGSFDTTGSACIYTGCTNDEFQPAIDSLIAASEADQAAAAQRVLEVFEEWTPIIPVAGAVYRYGVRSVLADTIVIQPNALFWIAPAA